LIERNGASGLVDVGSGQRVEVALLQAIAAGKNPHRLRPEILRSASRNGSTPSLPRARSPLSGHPDVYDIDLFGHRLELLELAPQPGTGRGRNSGFLAREGCGLS